MRPRKSGEIVATAEQLFLTRGFDATSLDDVAAASGVSKTTVYSNFRDKEALFAAVMTQVIGHAETIATSLSDLLAGDDAVELRLRSVGRRLVLGVLNPAVVQLRRIAVAEALRFPEVVSAYWQHAPAQTLTVLIAAFTEMDAAGDLSIADPSAAARQFAYAIVGPAQDRALLQPQNEMTRDELTLHSDAAVAAFIRAYRPDRPDRPARSGRSGRPGRMSRG